LAHFQTERKYQCITSKPNKEEKKKIATIQWKWLRVYGVENGSSISYKMWLVIKKS